MKKIFTARHLSLLLLLSLLGGKVQADRSCDDDRCGFGRSYECGCNPLNCGSFSLQFQGGVYPTIWAKRGDVLVNNCNALAANIVSDVGQLPKFNKFYKTPWIVGGEIGYALSDNANIFVEFNYAQAGGKDTGVNTTSGSASTGSSATATVSANSALLIKLEKYKLFSAYFGASYYFDRWCDRVSLFIGEKVGLIHHKEVDFLQLTTAATQPNPFYTNPTFFSSNTVISGGAHIGFDVCFCGNWALVLKGEVVASCGPRSVQSITLLTNDAAALAAGANPVVQGNANSLLIGSVQTELSFPVTLGVKYNF